METFKITVKDDLYIEVIYQMLKALDFIDIQREKVEKEAVRYDEMPIIEVYALGVESMRSEWDTPEDRVWNSLVTETE